MFCPSGASFAENFYDLKRVQSGKSAPEPLSRKAKWRSILFLVSDLSGTQFTCIVMIMMTMMVVVVVVVVMVMFGKTIFDTLCRKAKWRSVLFIARDFLERNPLAL